MQHKLCSDCAYYQHAPHSKEVNFDKCSNPAYVNLDLVRGDHKLPYCDSLRSLTGKCGIEASGFIFQPLETKEFEDEQAF